MPYPYNQSANTFVTYNRTNAIPDGTTTHTVLFIPPESGIMAVHLAKIRHTVTGTGGTSTGYVRFFLLEDPTYTPSGTPPVTQGNTDRRQPRTIESTVQINPNSVSGGTEIHRAYGLIRSVTEVALFDIPDAEIILKPNTPYILGFENQTGTTIDVSTHFTIYEAVDQT